MTPIYHSSTDRRVAQSELERGIIATLLERGVPIVESVKLGNNWVFDGAINGTTLLVEIHGDYWHQRPEVRARDKRKQEWAELNGYTITTIWEREYEVNPEEQLQRVLTTYANYTPSEIELPKVDTPRARRADYGDWRDTFLDALGETGIIRQACQAAGVSRQAVAKHRRDDPAFDAACQDARRDAADLLRAEYHKRAMQQSDRAMEYMLSFLDAETSPAAAVKLGTLDDQLAALEHAIDRVGAGDLSVVVARQMLYGISLARPIIQLGEMEERLKALEALNGTKA